MLLTDLIKVLVDALEEGGEQEVYICMEDSNKMYNHMLLHGLPMKEGNILRIEGISEETYERLDGVVDDALSKYNEEEEDGEDY